MGGQVPPNPVTKCVLLEELFGEILEVSLGEWDTRCHGDLRVAYNPVRVS